MPHAAMTWELLSSLFFGNGDAPREEVIAAAREHVADIVALLRTVDGLCRYCGTAFDEPAPARGRPSLYCPAHRAGRYRQAVHEGYAPMSTPPPREGRTSAAARPRAIQ